MISCIVVITIVVIVVMMMMMFIIISIIINTASFQRFDLENVCEAEGFALVAGQGAGDGRAPLRDHGSPNSPKGALKQYYPSKQENNDNQQNAATEKVPLKSLK